MKMQNVVEHLLKTSNSGTNDDSELAAVQLLLQVNFLEQSFSCCFEHRPLYITYNVASFVQSSELS